MSGADGANGDFVTIFESFGNKTAFNVYYSNKDGYYIWYFDIHPELCVDSEDVRHLFFITRNITDIVPPIQIMTCADIKEWKLMSNFKIKDNYIYYGQMFDKIKELIEVLKQTKCPYKERWLRGNITYMANILNNNDTVDLLPSDWTSVYNDYVMRSR